MMCTNKYLKTTFEHHPDAARGLNITRSVTPRAMLSVSAVVRELPWLTDCTVHWKQVGREGLQSAFRFCTYIYLFKHHLPTVIKWFLRYVYLRFAFAEGKWWILSAFRLSTIFWYGWLVFHFFRWFDAAENLIFGFPKPTFINLLCRLKRKQLSTFSDFISAKFDEWQSEFELAAGKALFPIESYLLSS